MDLDIINKWFSKGSMPTQEHFRQTFAFFRNKGEKIPLQEIEGIGEALSEKQDKKIWAEDTTTKELKLKKLKTYKASRVLCPHSKTLYIKNGENWYKIPMEPVTQ